MDDLELLRDYAASQSEQAFATIVGRHVDLVYSAALRQVHDPQLAEEVTQTVFVRLARKAGSIRVGVMLSGWLFRTTRFVASEVMRMEHRRRQREQNAMETLLESSTDPLWEQIAPLLDDALAGLSETDRNAMLLRFFERKSLKEVGLALGMNDDAAQKRITRALEKLRSILVKRGKLISASVLSGALSASAVHAAPAALTASVTAAAILSGLAAGSTLTMGSLKFMAWTNLKSAVAVGVCAVTAATTIVIESRHASKLRAENRRLAAQMGELQKTRANEMAILQPGDSELERLRREAAEVYKLRGEVAQLRRGKDDATKLRAQIDALQSKHEQASLSKDTDDPQPTPAEETQKQLGIAKMQYLRGWAVALRIFAEENNGRIPTELSEIKSLPPEPLNGQLDPSQFEIVYQGSLNNLQDAGRLIVMREKVPTLASNGSWVRAYGFADGHAEIHSAPTQDGFGIWEQERMAAGTPE